MEFRQWLILQEKAERTSSRVPLYPPQYHTKQYSPLYHAPYAADYQVWLHSKLLPYTYTDYQKHFGSKDEPPKPTWPKMGEDTPAHSETITDKFKWSLPD